jgi:hypothetical protein
MRRACEWFSIACNLFMLAIAVYGLSTRPQTVFDAMVLSVILCMLTASIALPIFFCWKVVFGK